MAEIGLLGELEVISVLKKLKHSVYVPLKDEGVDFMSVGKSGVYQVQVKTSMFQKGSYFWFDIHKNKMVYSNNTFYIFVCKVLGRRRLMGKSFNCLVIPSLKLKDWIDSRQIASKRGNKNILNIFVYPGFKNRKWVYRNKGRQLDLTKYWNNFKSLE